MPAPAVINPAPINPALVTPPGMVLIPAGTFKMGDASLEHSQPVRDVYVDAFFIDTHDVTVGQYRQFVADARASQTHWVLMGPEHGRGELKVLHRGASQEEVERIQEIIKNQNGYRANPLIDGAFQVFELVDKKLSEGFDDPQHPMVNVNWYEAQAFCNAWGGRLPYEAEYEKAARGPGGHEYETEADLYERQGWLSKFLGIGRKKRAHFEEEKTAKVGSYPPNGYGLYDMVGNVWKWCMDFWADKYDPRQVQNPSGPEPATEEKINSLHSVRGGAWVNLARHARVGDRLNPPDNYWYNFIGFRCVFVPRTSVL